MNYEYFEYHLQLTRRESDAAMVILETKVSQFFRNNSRNPQAPVTKQLEMFLFCIGCYGNPAGVSARAFMHEFPSTMMTNARNRVSSALASLLDHYIRWPDQSHKALLCSDAGQFHGFEHCLYYIDSSTNTLAGNPTVDLDKFCDRNSTYALLHLIANNFHGNVIVVFVVFSGTVHESRVLS